jgi:hypothetical protein
VYLIFPPLDTTLTLGGVTGFCGYHQNGQYNNNNLIWATVASYNNSSTGQAFVNSISYCITHELSEAFTNPTRQGWYAANVSGQSCEIGDICESNSPNTCCTTVPYTVSNRTYQVETYWSNLDSRCVIGPLDVILAKVAASQQFGLSNQTDVFVVDKNGQLNVCWVDSAQAWQGPVQIA